MNEELNETNLDVSEGQEELSEMPSTIDIDSKKNQYEKNIETGAVAAQSAMVGAMFTDGGLGRLMNRDKFQDANEDATF